VFTYIYSLLIKKDIVIVKTYKLNFHAFMYACHLKIFSFF
jgi:hypothetical protein